MGKSKSAKSIKKTEGSLTEALGKMTGDKHIEAKGAAKKKEGEAEHAATQTKTSRKT